LPEQNDYFAYAEDGGYVYNELKAGKRREKDPDLLLDKREWVIECDMMSPKEQEKVLREREKQKKLEEEDEEFDEHETIDNTFKLFQLYDQHCPGHILRYNFGKKTQPLYYSDYDQFSHPPKEKCKHCDGNLVFEFQLNVQLLSKLSYLADLEWGMIAFYSCEKSCSHPSQPYLEEHVELQSSPEDIDAHNLKRLNDRKLKEFELDMDEGGVDIEEEIKKLKAEARHAQARNTKPSSLPVELTMEEKKPPVEKGIGGKLFEQDDDDDNWE
jgi:hypothetical protein